MEFLNRLKSPTPRFFKGLSRNAILIAMILVFISQVIPDDQTARLLNIISACIGTLIPLISHLAKEPTEEELRDLLDEKIQENFENQLNPPLE